MRGEDKRKAPAKPPLSDWSRHVPALAARLAVATMMLCLAGSALLALERFVPNWNGTYLLWVSFTVSLEAQIAQRIRQNAMTFSREWLLLLITEWVVLLTAIKVLLYLIHGPARFLADAILWQKDFFPYFFTQEYLVSLTATLVVWLITVSFAGLLAILEEDPDRIAQERLGYVFVDRSQVRGQLAGLIFGLGAGMMVLAAIARIDVGLVQQPPVSKPANLLFMMLFFACGLTLLAQTQLAMLRTRWSLEEIPVSQQIGCRWVISSLIILAVLAGVALFLPTHYSINILGILNAIISILLILVNILMLLVFVPVFFLFNLLASLFASRARLQSYPQLPLPPVPAFNGFTDPIIELLKSILFWSLFFSIIFLSTKFYLSRLGEIWANLRGVPLLSWLADVWRGLINWLRSARETMRNSLGIGIQRMRGRLQRYRHTAPQLPRTPGPRQPRDQVIACYLDMIRRNAKLGLARRSSQTPDEYADMLYDLLPAEEHTIQTLTDAFYEARYSLHDIRPAEVNRVREAVNRIVRALHDLQSDPGHP